MGSHQNKQTREVGEVSQIPKSLTFEKG